MKDPLRLDRRSIVRRGEKMTKAIIFDMDGTLFQTNLILEPALEATFDVLRKNELWEGITPIEQYRAIMGVPLPIVWETLCPEHSDVQRIQSNRIFQEKLISLIEMNKGALYQGVEETLCALSKRYPLYIASNGQQEYLDAIVKTFTLDRYIESVYSIDRIASGNKSELVTLVKEENHIETGFVVGDRSSDILAAKDNHLQSIGVRFDFAQEDELSLADYVIDSLGELLQLVTRRV